jgi:hypothetical protein
MQVVSSISCIREDSVEFEDGKNCYFDSIVFATGYKSTANMWLKVCMYVYQQQSVMEKLLFLPLMKTSIVAVFKSVKYVIYLCQP